MKSTQTLTLVALLTCINLLQSCSLGGDLCLWNTYGFDAVSNPDGGGKVLYSETNNSYIQSWTYFNNSESTCKLTIKHSPYSENTTGLNVYKIVGNTWTRLNSRRTLDSSTSSADVGVTYQQFRLTVQFTSSDIKSNLTIQSVDFSHCTQKRLMPYPRVCSVVNSTMCDGWNITKKSTQFLYEAKDDYIWLDSSNKEEIDPETTRLHSPYFPYLRNSACKVSFLYHVSGYKNKVPPTLRLHFYHEAERFGGSYLLNTTISGHWTFVETPLTTHYTRFQVVFSSHSGSTVVGAGIKIANITVSKDCFPQLTVKHETQEAIRGQSKSHAELISVADRATSYWFTTCGSTGRTGPTSEQCNEFYPVHRTPFVKTTMDDENMPGVQIWQVPKTDEYDITLYGAAGGFGIDSTTTNGMIRGVKYVSQGVELPCWQSRIHIRANLTKDEKLMSVVGQAGTMACERFSYKHCRNENFTSPYGYGGGGGGGGATMVFLEKNDTLHLLAMAGGGGGMGRRDFDLNLDQTKYLEMECLNNLCNGSEVRPGFGGSYAPNASYAYKSHKSLRQDGRSLASLLSSNSMQGGKGCFKYKSYFETHGGFGGGGGGCTAGGGGGGYYGGNASLLDSDAIPGQVGSSYHNPDFAVLRQFDPHDPFLMQHPDGLVEVTPIPPKCTCGGDRQCRWNDANYTSFMCLCNGTWTERHQLYSCPILSVDKDAEVEQVGKMEQQPDYVIYALLAGVVFVLVVIIAVFCIKRKYRRNIGYNANVKFDSNPDYGICDPLLTMLSEDRIKVVRCLGEGRFSKVYQANLALGDTWNSEEISVAIKKPIYNTVQTRHDFLLEAKTISSFNHPNIMKILGICDLSDGGVGIVMNVLKGGDLRTFLRNQPNIKTGTYSLIFGDLIRIASEIASACKYLEEMKFIHRDIAARNVLLTDVDAGRVAKISDFGLSRDINHGDYYCHRSPMKVIPIRWYPPEAVKKNRQTTKSDVWSFGILLWEVFTLGEQPYPDIMDNRQVAEILESGYTMDPPSTCPLPIGELMRKCWKFDPVDRPAFSFISLQLSHIMQNKQMMATPVTGTTHARLSSVTSSASSGFDESLESPSCLSLKPLLNDSSYPEGER